MSQESNLRMLRFNQWNGGESGTFQDNGPPNSFYGVNMQVYKNGTLGIRPGFKALDDLNLSFGAGDKFGGAMWVPTDDRSTYPEGLVFYWWYDDSASAWKHVKWDFDAGSTTNYTSTEDPPLSNPTDFLADFQWSHELACDTVIMYGQMRMNSGGGSGTTITPPNSFEPGRAVYYRDRAYYFRPNSKSARVYYSDAGAPFTFTDSDQFFDIGTTDDAYVQGAYPLKGGLVFYVTAASPRGYGEWWVMTGASPRTGTLRRFAVGPVPRNEFSVATYGEKLYFLADDNESIVVIDGASVDQRSMRHLRGAGSNVAMTATSSKARQAFTCVKSDALVLAYNISSTPSTVELRPPFWEGVGALEMVNGVWTRHDYHASLDPASTNHYGILSVMNFDHDKIGMLYSDIDFDTIVGSNIAFSFLSRDICLDRPGKATDTFSSNVDEYKAGGEVSVDGEVHMRQIKSEDGRPFTVRRVEIDIDYWADDGTVYGACGLDLDIGYSHAAPDWGVSEAFTAGDSVSFTNTTESLADNTSNFPKRATFAQNMAESRSVQAAELHLTNINNLAIREIRVWIKYESSPNAL